MRCDRPLLIGIVAIAAILAAFCTIAEVSEDSDAATCSTCGGSGKVTCSSCGGAGNTQVQSGSGADRICTVTGCTRCGGSGSMYFPVAQPQYQYGSVTNGSGTVTCSTCSGSGTVPDPHTHSYSISNRDYGDCSGCVYTYTCSCGDSYTSGTKYDSHSYSSQGTSYGACHGSVTTYKCSRCGDTYTSGTAYDHSYSSRVTKAATCTSTGVRTYTCSYCGDSYTSTISKTSHSFTSHSAVSATCTSTGNAAYYTCSGCGGYFTSSKTSTTWSALQTSALGHSYGSWTTTKAATCEGTGTQSHACSRCGGTETRTIAAIGHSYSASGYSWASDCSFCTVSFTCSNDSGHASSCIATPASDAVRDSEVLSHTIYTVSGTDAATNASYDASRTLYTHTAILRYDARGGTGTFADQTASYTAGSPSPSGSETFTTSSMRPAKSESVFFGWSETVGGSVAATAGGSIAVPYGTVRTVYAVYEDVLEWTSVPTASCVVQAEYGYGDDGTPVLQSKADGYGPMTIGADTWTDPGYRDPPAAETVTDVTDDLVFQSNDPAYAITWTMQDSSGASNDGVSQVATYLGLYAVQGRNGSWTMDSQECLPSWITWTYDNPTGSAEGGRLHLTIRPALQQVSEDTHGDYWIWWTFTRDTGSIFGSSQTYTYLLRFSVDVSWAGGVIVPETYSLFVLRLDFGLPNGMNNITLRQQLPADASEYRFPIDAYSAVRDGYTFKGWSLTSGSSTTDAGEEFPLNIDSASTRTSTDESGNPIHTATLYAVWEKDQTPDPVLPDFLRELLELLSDPYVLGLLLVIVFGAACLVRVRRQGMM